jgi:hypothetical protein
MGESEAWDGSTDEGEACDSPQGGSDGWDGLQRGSEACDSPQIEQDEPIDEPINQYCSSCNQKKPLIDFGRFLTCNSCRQRNQKAKQARRIKQRPLLNKNNSNKSSPS